MGQQGPGTTQGPAGLGQEGGGVCLRASEERGWEHVFVSSRSSHPRWLQVYVGNVGPFSSLGGSQLCWYIISTKASPCGSSPVLRQPRTRSLPGRWYIMRYEGTPRVIATCEGLNALLYRSNTHARAPYVNPCGFGHGCFCTSPLSALVQTNP
jgi:hypothetical protein